MDVLELKNTGVVKLRGGIAEFLKDESRSISVYESAEEPESPEKAEVEEVPLESVEAAVELPDPPLPSCNPLERAIHTALQITGDPEIVAKLGLAAVENCMFTMLRHVLRQSVHDRPRRIEQAIANMRENLSDVDWLRRFRIMVTRAGITFEIAKRAKLLVTQKWLLREAMLSRTMQEFGHGVTRADIRRDATMALYEYLLDLVRSGKFETPLIPPLFGGARFSGTGPATNREEAGSPK